MNYFEKTLLNFLRDSKIEMEITGFDMDSFEQILSQELKWRLEMIEGIAFEDDGLMSDAEKVESIKRLIRREFYNEG